MFYMSLLCELASCMKSALNIKLPHPVFKLQCWETVTGPYKDFRTKYLGFSSTSPLAFICGETVKLSFTCELYVSVIQTALLHPNVYWRDESSGRCSHFLTQVEWAVPSGAISSALSISSVWPPESLCGCLRKRRGRRHRSEWSWGKNRGGGGGWIISSGLKEELEAPGLIWGSIESHLLIQFQMTRPGSLTPDQMETRNEWNKWKWAFKGLSAPSSVFLSHTNRQVSLVLIWCHYVCSLCWHANINMGTLDDSQQMRDDKKHPEWININLFHGVPQGSVLGPILISPDYTTSAIRPFTLTWAHGSQWQKVKQGNQHVWHLPIKVFQDGEPNVMVYRSIWFLFAARWKSVEFLLHTEALLTPQPLQTASLDVREQQLFWGPHPASPTHPVRKTNADHS